MVCIHKNASDLQTTKEPKNPLMQTSESTSLKLSSDKHEELIVVDKTNTSDEQESLTATS
jgi:hypothetical protein